MVAAKNGSKKKPERATIDFNRILRNRKGEPYRTQTGAALRLGHICVDALDASGGKPGTEAAEKLRRDSLAKSILNMDFDEAVESAPYNVLKLPERIQKLIDDCVDENYRAGMYAAAHRLLIPDDEQPEFDDIEVVGPGTLEEDDGVQADEVLDDEPDDPTSEDDD